MLDVEQFDEQHRERKPVPLELLQRASDQVDPGCRPLAAMFFKDLVAGRRL